MQRTKYLNVMLTVNAALMTALLWCAVVGSPMLDSRAEAQTFTRPSQQNPKFEVPTIPNAAKQRYEMVEALRAIERKVDATNQLLSNGRLRVEVTNADRLRSNE